MTVYDISRPKQYDFKGSLTGRDLVEIGPVMKIKQLLMVDIARQELKASRDEQLNSDKVF